MFRSNYDNPNVRSKYHLTKELGCGAYGTVYLAKHRISGEEFAVKEIPKWKVKNLSGLRREINVMKALDKSHHPNILELKEVFENGQHLHLVIELCSGGEIFDQIVKDGHLSEEDAAACLKQVLDVLSVCHKLNIAHRDLKPQNLLLSAPVDHLKDASIKVADWGTSRIYGGNHEMHEIIGTPDYMAPEVFSGTYDDECDLWSLGVILYQMISGDKPFADRNAILHGQWGFTNAALWDDVSDECKDLITRMLAYDPAQRITAEQALTHPWIAHMDSDGDDDGDADDNVSEGESEGKNDPYMTTSMHQQRQLPSPDKHGSAKKTRRLRRQGQGRASKTHLRKRRSRRAGAIARLQKFRATNRVQRKLLQSFAESISLTGSRALCKEFQKIDINRDGMISMRELDYALGRADGSSRHLTEKVAQIMRACDADDDFKISYQEFMAGALQRVLVQQQAQLGELQEGFGIREFATNAQDAGFTRADSVQIFKSLDANRDGTLDHKEISRLTTPVTSAHGHQHQDQHQHQHQHQHQQYPVSPSPPAPPSMAAPQAPNTHMLKQIQDDQQTVQASLSPYGHQHHHQHQHQQQHQQQQQQQQQQQFHHHHHQAHHHQQQQQHYNSRPSTAAGLINPASPPVSSSSQQHQGNGACSRFIPRRAIGPLKKYCKTCRQHRDFH